jgi:DnaJ family protein B protein 6
VGVNPLVELAVGAARVARIAFVRFVATFGARILQQIIRFILRRIFGGGRF